jgi:hypothetical protein
MFAPIRRSNHKNFDIHISAQLHSGRLVIYEVLPSPLPVQLAMLRLGQASRRFLKTRLPIRRSGLAILPIYHLEDANG